MRPNGLAFSPDDKILYVNNSDAAKNLVMRYDVAADGTLEQRARVRGPHEQGRRPGRRDEGGCEGEPLHLRSRRRLGLSPDGKHLGTIQPPETPANCGWGDDGKTLYMTAVTGVYRVRTLVGRK